LFIVCQWHFKYQVQLPKHDTIFGNNPSFGSWTTGITIWCYKPIPHSKYKIIRYWSVNCNKLETQNIYVWQSASMVLWSEERMCEGWVCLENPVMTFPIKKRINTELFIERMAALFLRFTSIWVKTSEGVEPVSTRWLVKRAHLGQKCFLDLQRCGNERSGVKLSWNEFNRKRL